MGTLIKLKAGVVNPELPVLTEQGILPYYTGVYVNKLAEKGVTLTQTEIDAVTTFINSLIDADVLDKIGTFYPFLGNPNVPLIGLTEYGYTDVTSTNTALDFVNNNLRGYKLCTSMSDVKLGELTATDFGVMWGGSLISKVPTDNSAISNNIINFRNTENTSQNISYVQLRLNYYVNNYKFRIFAQDAEGTKIEQGYNPSIDATNNLQNFAFAYGLSNKPSEVPNILGYNRTLYRNGVKLANSASYDTANYIHNEDLSVMVPFTFTNNQSEWVMTTLSFFNRILTETESAAFCEALNTFTAAVGKTVSVG